MELNSQNLLRKHNIIQEQLLTLWTFHKDSSVANEFANSVKEEFPTNMTASKFTEVCYFLLGLISKEQRDKLIVWPIIHIQEQVKFRKGVSAIMKDLIKKYPQVSLKQMPESYFIDPSQNPKKNLDFIMKLANLAIYLTLNDPHLLDISPKNGMNVRELQTATKTLMQARMKEEKIIEENMFPMEKFESIKNCVTQKIVALKQENSNLTNKLNKLKKTLVENGLVQSENDFNLDYVKNAYDEKLSELMETNHRLKEYSGLCREIANCSEASGEHFSLTADNLGVSENEGNFEGSTAVAYDELMKTFDYIKCNELVPAEMKDCLGPLLAVRDALLREKNALERFLTKHSYDDVRIHSESSSGNGDKLLNEHNNLAREDGRGD